MSTAYRLEPIEEIIDVAFGTARIRGAIPISLILVADSGGGKSKMLSRYAGDSIHVTQSFTSQGLFELMQHDSENKIRFLLTADLNPTLSRKPATVEATVANLLSVTADGTTRIDDGRQEKVCKHAPVGIITAVTPDLYHKQAKKWFALGLRRRIIPIFYTYSTETLAAIMEQVRKGKIDGSDFPEKKIEFPASPAYPAIGQLEASQLESLAQTLAQNLGKLNFRDGQVKKWVVRKVLPISPVITLRSLAQARALAAKRGKVNADDVSFARRFVDFTDPESPVKI